MFLCFATIFPSFLSPLCALFISHFCDCVQTDKYSLFQFVYFGSLSFQIVLYVSVHMKASFNSYKCRNVRSSIDSQCFVSCCSTCNGAWWHSINVWCFLQCLQCTFYDESEFDSCYSGYVEKKQWNVNISVLYLSMNFNFSLSIKFGPTIVVC